MSLSNSLTIDLVGQTIVSSSLFNGNQVDLITYNNTNQTITFGNRPAITLNGLDFLDLFNSIISFQGVITSNFNPFQPLSNFGSVQVQEQNNGTNWTLQVSVGSGSPFINDTATLSGKTVTLSNRALSKTFNYCEWSYMLPLLAHYQTSVRTFFSL